MSAASCAAAWLGWSEHVAAARAIGASAVEVTGTSATAPATSAVTGDVEMLRDA